MAHWSKLEPAPSAFPVFGIVLLSPYHGHHENPAGAFISHYQAFPGLKPGNQKCGPVILRPAPMAEKMKKIMPVIFLAILLPAGIVAMGGPPAGRDQFLSPADARKAAVDGYNWRSWSFPPEYARAMKGARAGAPLLVERLDRKDSFYYIVPFVRAGKATLLVMIDARSGDFNEAVPLAQPSAYPPVSADEAKERLAASPGFAMPEAALARLRTSLVWKPSEQSQSPFEPLWRFLTGLGVRYVDQKGKVHPSIDEPHLKGG